LMACSALAQPRIVPFSSMGSPPAWRIEPASARVMVAAACWATASSRRDQATPPVRRTIASSRLSAGIGDGSSCSCTRPLLPRPAAGVVRQSSLALRWRWSSSRGGELQADLPPGGGRPPRHGARSLGRRRQDAVGPRGALSIPLDPKERGRDAILAWLLQSPAAVPFPG
jgi:hypothetical protein